MPSACPNGELPRTAEQGTLAATDQEVIAAMALGVLGIVVKGLLYLLFTGIGLLLIAFLMGALWMRRRTRRRTR